MESTGGTKPRICYVFLLGREVQVYAFSDELRSNNAHSSNSKTSKLQSIDHLSRGGHHMDLARTTLQHYLLQSGEVDRSKWTRPFILTCAASATGMFITYRTHSGIVTGVDWTAQGLVLWLDNDQKIIISIEAAFTLLWHPHTGQARYSRDDNGPAPRSSNRFKLLLWPSGLPAVYGLNHARFAWNLAG